MTAATSRLRRRGIGAGVAALVGLSGLGLAAMPAQAAAGFDPAASQVSGVDRFDTAARVATTAFTSASTVVVANGDRAIDAQAGAYVAGLNNAPILLTQKSNVPSYTVDAIKKLGATKAIVLGDSNSVDATALAQMTAAGLTVQVVSGSDRFATAAAIYNLGSTKASTVFLARADLLAGQVSPDALAASPLAYDGTPVLLTNAASLPQATADAIKNGGVKNVVVLGNAITDSVKNAVTALGATVTTIAGDDRSLTAQKIADYGIAQGKYMKTTATIANGDKIDALAAGPWAAKNNAPILLTLGTNTLGTGTSGYLAANASTLTKATVFGDSASVPASLTAAAKTAAGGDVTSNQAYSVSPNTATSKVVSTTGTSTSTDTQGNIQYTVSGLGSTAVNIALVNPANVVTNASGQTTFKSGATAGQADLTGAAGYIGVVNGVATAGAGTQLASNITPSNGSVTFTLNSTAPGGAVPVVFSNADSNTVLEIPSTTTVSTGFGLPSGAFGVGGAATWTATAANTGAYTAAVATTGTQSGNSVISVTSVNATAGTFQGTYVPNNAATPYTPVAGTFQFAVAGSNYNYSANSSLGTVPVTQAQFTSSLSAGDTVSASYNNSGPSSLSLTVDKPAAPTGVTVATSKSASSATYNDNVTVSWTAPANLDVDTYTVQRATVNTTTGAVGSFASIKTGIAAGTTTFQDSTANSSSAPAAGTSYQYKVVAVGTGTNGNSDASTASSTIVYPSAPVTGAVAGAPTVSIADLTTDAGAPGVVDAGDVWTLVFNQPVTITAPVNVTVTDADGTVTTVSVPTANISNTTATTYNGTTYNAGQVLTLTLGTTGGATISSSGGNNVGQYTATITGVNGVKDADEGLAVNVSGSSDKSIG